MALVRSVPDPAAYGGLGDLKHLGDAVGGVSADVVEGEGECSALFLEAFEVFGGCFDFVSDFVDARFEFVEVLVVGGADVHCSSLSCSI